MCGYYGNIIFPNKGNVVAAKYYIHEYGNKRNELYGIIRYKYQKISVTVKKLEKLCPKYMRSIIKNPQLWENSKYLVPINDINELLCQYTLHNSEGSDLQDFYIED